MRELPVQDIWGIGRKSAELLGKHGITNALELKNAPDDWIRKTLSITGLYIVKELRGIKCFELEDEPASKKGITSSRSFGKAVTDLKDLEEAVATYVSRAAEKLRDEKLAARYLRVYIRTNHFNLDKKYIAGKGVYLPVATAYTPTLIHYALELLKTIYKEGYRYYKAGITFMDLVPEGSAQQNLFVQFDHHKETRLMQSVDKLNARFGVGAITYAAMGIEQGWKMKREFGSPHYTTSFTDLPIVR